MSGRRRGVHAEIQDRVFLNAGRLPSGKWSGLEKDMRGGRCTPLSFEIRFGTDKIW